MTDESQAIYWKQIDPLGHLFTPAYEGDAGFDLAICATTVLDPGKLSKVPCGIRIALPDKVGAILMPRSSTVIHGLLVVSTLIDCGYRGDMFLFIYNTTDKYVQVQAGTRLAQLLLIQNALSRPITIQTEELPPSHRGENGFGSSGS
jgi:deoxyuridine 5'-triphosphate nucleotidohydrolase